MEVSVKLYGLEESLKAIQAAFPNDQKIQARIINGSIGAAARKTMLPVAKQLALQGDESGALSESLAVRAMGKRKRGPRPWGMELVPVRDSMKAMALYMQHYFQGAPPASVLASGIRHGHLIEFGFDYDPHKTGNVRRIEPTPFLWPAAETMKGAYREVFAVELKKRTEREVRKRAKLAAKK